MFLLAASVCTTPACNAEESWLAHESGDGPESSPSDEAEFLEFEAGSDVAFETVVVESWAMIWLYADASACEQIPQPGSSAEELFTYFTETFALANIADATIDAYLPYYYLAGTEVGIGASWTRPLRELLRYEPNNFTAFMPEGYSVDVDHSVLRDVRRWVARKSDHMIFIYGANDPYTSQAYKVPQSQRRDTASYLAPEGNHLTRIGDLSPEDRERVHATLERWTGVAIED